MTKIKGRIVMAKLIRMKKTTVWLTKEQQEIADDLKITNQQLAQTAFDVALGFIVSINLESKKRTVLDYDGEELADSDKKILAKAFVKEYLRTLQKNGDDK